MASKFWYRWLWKIPYLLQIFANSFEASLEAIWRQKDVYKFEASKFYLQIRLANFIF